MTINKEELKRFIEDRINIKKSNITGGYCQKKKDLETHIIQIDELEYILSAIEYGKLSK